MTTRRGPAIQIGATGGDAVVQLDADGVGASNPVRVAAQKDVLATLDIKLENAYTVYLELLHLIERGAFYLFDHRARCVVIGFRYDGEAPLASTAMRSSLADYRAGADSPGLRDRFLKS